MCNKNTRWCPPCLWIYRPQHMTLRGSSITVLICKFTKKGSRIQIWIRIHLCKFCVNSVCLPVSARVERRRVARALWPARSKTSSWPAVSPSSRHTSYWLAEAAKNCVTRFTIVKKRAFLEPCWFTIFQMWIWFISKIINFLMRNI